MKQSITAAERLQLIGLLALAEKHNAWLKDIEAAASALLSIEHDAQGVNNPRDHLMDAVYGSTTIDELLEQIHVASRGE